MRVEPAFKVAISGACRARTPISPSAPGTISISASPSNAGPSGVTSEIEKVLAKLRRDAGGLRLGLGARDVRVLRLLLLGRRRLFLALELASLGDGVLDRADHVERLLGQVVVLALEDLAEALDRVLELHVLAGG